MSPVTIPLCFYEWDQNIYGQRLLRRPGILFSFLSHAPSLSSLQRGIWIHRKLQKNKEGLHAASGGMEMSHFKMQRSTATPGGENPNGEMGKEVKTLPLPVQRSAAPPNGNKSSDQFETFATSLQSTPRSTTSKSRVTPSSIDDGLHGYACVNL